MGLPTYIGPKCIVVDSLKIRSTWTLRQMLPLRRGRLWSLPQSSPYSGGGFIHDFGPAWGRKFCAFDFVVQLGEFAGIQPDTGTFRALVDLDSFSIGKPFAIKDLLRAARAHPGFGRIRSVG